MYKRQINPETGTCGLFLQPVTIKCITDMSFPTLQSRWLYWIQWELLCKFKPLVDVSTCIPTCNICRSLILGKLLQVNTHVHVQCISFSPSPFPPVRGKHCSLAVTPWLEKIPILLKVGNFARQRDDLMLCVTDLAIQWSLDFKTSLSARK